LFCQPILFFFLNIKEGPSTTKLKEKKRFIQIDQKTTLRQKTKKSFTNWLENHIKINTIYSDIPRKPLVWNELPLTRLRPLYTPRLFRNTILCRHMIGGCGGIIKNHATLKTHTCTTHTCTQGGGTPPGTLAWPPPLGLWLTPSPFWKKMTPRSDVFRQKLHTKGKNYSIFRQKTRTEGQNSNKKLKKAV
jgi:hypothetical protein